MRKRDSVIIPFARVMRDCLTSRRRKIRNLAAQVEAKLNATKASIKKNKLLNCIVAHRTPLETVRAARTRLPSDKPVSFILFFRALVHGGQRASENQKALTQMYGLHLTSLVQALAQAGIGEPEREAQIETAMRSRGLPLAMTFEFASQKRCEYLAKFGREPVALAPELLKTSGKRIDLRIFEQRCDWLRVLHIARARATQFDLGVNDLESENIKKGRVPGFNRLYEGLLGTVQSQKALELNPGDTLNVAMQGFVNPAQLWFDILVYSDLFELAVFIGKSAAGHEPQCTRRILHTYLAEVANAMPRKHCNPRAEPDRLWYARAIREYLESPDCAIAKSALTTAACKHGWLIKLFKRRSSADQGLYTLVS